MRYYSWHIGDYASATAHLSNEEDLCYRRLLDLYYDTEQPIPAATRQVARKVRCRVDTVERVLQEFFVTTESGYRHARADEELAKMRKRSEVSRSNGVRGGRPRSQEKPTGFPAGSQQDAASIPEETQTKATHIPIYPVTHTSSTSSGSVAANTKRTTVRPDGVSDQVWADFVAHRKAKRSTITATVIGSIEREAKLAGWTLEQALGECVARGWQGFKAEWVKGKTTTRTFAEVEYRDGDL